MSALQRLYDALETEDQDTAADIFSNHITIDLLALVPGKGKSVLQKLWELDHERGDSLFSDAVLGVENLSEKKFKQYSKAYDKIALDLLAASAAKAAPKKVSENNVAAAAGGPGPAAPKLNAANASLFPKLGAVPPLVTAAPPNVPKNTNVQLAREFIPIASFSNRDAVLAFLRTHYEFNPLTVIPEYKTSVWHLLLEQEMNNPHSPILKIIQNFYNRPAYNKEIAFASTVSKLPNAVIIREQTPKQAEIYAALQKARVDHVLKRNSPTPEMLYAKEYFFLLDQNNLKTALQTPDTFLTVLKQYSPERLISRSPINTTIVLFPFSSFKKKKVTPTDDSLLRASLEYILPGHSLEDLCTTGKTNKKGNPISCVPMLMNYGYVTTVEYLLDNGYKTLYNLQNLLLRYKDKELPASIATQYASHLTRDELVKGYKTQFGTYISFASVISANYPEAIPVLFSKGIFGLIPLHSSSLYTTTPLYFASEAKNKDAIAVLLTNLGADINSLDSANHSILYYVMLKELDMTGQLIAAGATLDIPGQDTSELLGVIVPKVYEKKIKDDSIEAVLSVFSSDDFKKWIKGIEAGTKISLASSLTVKYPEKVSLLFSKGIFGLTPYGTPHFNTCPLYFAAKYNVDISFDTLLANLGADINSLDGNGLTLFFYLLFQTDIKYAKKLVDAGANPNQITMDLGRAVNITPFIEVAHHIPRTDPKRDELLIFLVELPSFDLDINIQACKDYIKALPRVANIDRVIAALRVLETRKRNSVLYRGYTQAQLRELNRIVEDPADLSICPVCLSTANRSEGCLYMTHNCSKLGISYHEELYEKYKNDRGDITWCTMCSRIGMTRKIQVQLNTGEWVWRSVHEHLQLGPATGPKTGPAPLRGAENPFDRDCVSQGGGGVLEKYMRVHRLREFAYDLQGEVGKLSEWDAKKELIEEVWNAPLASSRRAKALKEEMEQIFSTEILPAATARRAAALAATAVPGTNWYYGPAPPGPPKPFKPPTIHLTSEEDDRLNAIWSKYGRATTNFPKIDPKEAEERAAALARNAALEARARENLPRPNAGNASLQPREIREGECFVCNLPNYPLWGFHHKEPNGTVQDHDGMPLCNLCLADAITSKLKEKGLEPFGRCWLYPTCKALFWPQEIQGKVPADLYEAYRIAFNKKYLEGLLRGGMRGGAYFQVGGVPFLTPMPTGSVQCTAPNGVSPTTCSKCKTRRGGRRKQQRRRRTIKRR